MAPRSSSSKTASTFLHTLASPIRGLSLIGHAHSPSATSDPDTKTSSAPVSWICHHCIYVLPLADASSSFGEHDCQGCGHERCGLCDVVYVSQEQGVETGRLASVPEPWYHWDDAGPQSLHKLPTARA